MAAEGTLGPVLSHPGYTRERIRIVAREVRALVHADVRPLAHVRIAGPAGRIPYDEAVALDYVDAAPGMPLGPLWATWWLDVEGVVPPEWDGERVDLLTVTHSEGTVWLDGAPVQGIVSTPAAWRPDALLRT